MSLMKDGLWRIVDGSECAPEEGTDGYSKFVTRRDALAIIVLSVDPSLLYIIGDPRILLNRPWFGGSSPLNFKEDMANKLALRRRLHSLRLKEGGRECSEAC